MNARFAEFSIESLERRRLLAGVVTVELDANDDLTLIGDNQANNIELKDVGHALELRGYNGTQLRINGQLYEQFEFDFPHNNLPAALTIKMRGGDDYFSTNKIDFVHGELAIDLGSGDDRMSLPSNFSHGMSVQGDILIKSGSGSDVIELGNIEASSDLEFDLRGERNSLVISRLHAVGELEIDGRGGTDIVGLHHITAEELDVNARGGFDYVMLQSANISGDVEIGLGSGGDDPGTPNYNDVFILRADDGDDVTVESNLTITGGGGIQGIAIAADEDSDLDIGGLVKIRTGGADDLVSIFAEQDGDVLFDGGLIVDAGGGDDLIRIEALGANASVIVAEESRLKSSGGNDTLEMTDVGFDGPLVVETGSGNDTVSLDGTRTFALSVRLGGGSDMLSGNFPTFVGPTRFDGGGGNDISTLVDYFLILPATVEFVSF